MNCQTTAKRPLSTTTSFISLWREPTNIRAWMGKLAPSIWAEVGRQFEFDFVVMHWTSETRYIARWYTITPDAQAGTVIVTYRDQVKKAALGHCTWNIFGTTARGGEPHRLGE